MKYSTNKEKKRRGDLTKKGLTAQNIVLSPRALAIIPESARRHMQHIPYRTERR